MVNSCRETQYLIVNADAPHFAILQCGFRRALITNFVSEQIIHSSWFSIPLNLFLFQSMQSFMSQGVNLRQCFRDCKTQHNNGVLTFLSTFIIWSEEIKPDCWLSSQKMKKKWTPGSAVLYYAPYVVDYNPHNSALHIMLTIWSCCHRTKFPFHIVYPSLMCSCFSFFH